jgi:hypothetical protein
MATAQQKAQAAVYRDAAVEHVTVARELYDADRLLLANYVSGLAVECILRAYRLRIDPAFDARHDVLELYKLAQFADVVPEKDTESISAALGDVIALWGNDHRFLTTAVLRKRWTQRQLYRGIHGDFVKELVRRLVNAANRIVTIGVARWKSSFQN